MPSFAYTPAALKLTGGAFSPSPIRFDYTAAAMALSGGKFGIATAYNKTTSAVTNFKLDRLGWQLPIVRDDGSPAQKFQLDYQRNCESTEAAIASLNAQVTDLTSIVAQITAAQKAASTAVQIANAANDKIDLANSYTDPLEGIVTASSAGAINIAAHTRIYSATVSVAVNAGSVSGFASGQFVRVFYSDPARTGGAVAYQGTTNEVVQQGATHVVGGVKIPAIGTPDTTGAGTVPPGYVPDYGSFNLL